MAFFCFVCGQPLPQADAVPVCNLCGEPLPPAHEGDICADARRCMDAFDMQIGSLMRLRDQSFRDVRFRTEAEIQER